MDDSIVLLLIKVITALYLNDKANDDDKHIYDELKTIVAEIKPNKRSINFWLILPLPVVN